MSELEFAQEVARHLGSGWTARVESDRRNMAYLYKDSVERLLLKGDDWDLWAESRRVEVHGIFPNFEGQPALSWYGDNKKPYITCAKNLGPENLARAIKSRFFPKFWPYVEQAEKVVREMQARWERRKANARELADILGTLVGNGRGQEAGAHDQLSASLTGADGLYGNIRVFEKSLTLTVNNCPIDLGLKIAQLIVDNRG